MVESVHVSDSDSWPERGDGERVIRRSKHRDRATYSLEWTVPALSDFRTRV